MKNAIKHTGGFYSDMIDKGFKLIPTIDKEFVAYFIISFVVALFIGWFILIKYDYKNRNNKQSTSETPRNSLNFTDPNAIGILQGNNIGEGISNKKCSYCTTKKLINRCHLFFTG